MEFHPLSNIFPLVTGDDFAALVKDIEANGQREAIVLHDGKILDGRNRFRACRECGIEPTTRVFEGGNPLEYVLSLNMFRRQLTIAQRSVIAAELAVMGRKDDDDSDHDETDDGGISIEDAAKLMGISPRSVSSAVRVHREGIPELVEAVKTGVVSVSAAEHITKLDLAEQHEICERGPRAIRKAAREMRETNKPAKATLAKQEPAAPKSAAPWESLIGSHPQQKKSIQRFLALAEQGMEEGRDADDVASEILEYLNDGLDTQALLFAISVAEKLATSTALLRFRRG
jgi:uncharacterized protein YoaH (UPF0181 family)